MTDNDDYQLIKNFLDGDESAFNKIALKYQKRIYWHALRMLGNHHDADEVAQEVLIVIYKKLYTFNFKSALFTWIYRITSTRCLNHIKKRKVKKILMIDDPEVKELNARDDVAGSIEEKEKLEKLNSVLQKLPVKQREVFIMRNFDQLSYDEIAEATNKSVGALKANYFHALKKVTELMEDE